MDDADRKAIGQAVKEYLAREGLSREEFAYRVKIPKATIDKLVTGLFSDKTLIRLERAVGRSFRKSGSSLDRAAEQLGHYLHADYKHLEGNYLLVRPAFDDPKFLCLFPMKVFWDDAHPGLCLGGASEHGFTKNAALSIPRNSSYFFAVSNESGWNATMIMSLIGSDDVITGGLYTLGNISSNAFIPCLVPALLERQGRSMEIKPVIIGPDASRYEGYSNRLRAIMQRKDIRIFAGA